jgi:secreted PhoX family phosphatase
VVASLDDSTPGQVYVYAGDKRKRGNVVQRAGLDGGNLYGVKVEGYPDEPASGIPSGTRFTGFDHGDVRNKAGAVLDTESNAGGVTRFQRPEDGAWDPTEPRVFYFVTTASFTGNSRLWRLTFDDPRNPAAGGVIDMLLDGTEGQKMMDNITVDARGRRVVIQEDPGNQAHLAAVWSYDVRSDRLTKVAQHDPARFTPGPAFMTQDEESSGIIDMSRILGRGWFLGDTQVHKANPDPELVEYGQMWALHLPDGSGGHDDHDGHDDRD